MIVVLNGLAAVPARGQTQQSGPLTLAQAVDLAIRNYPAIKASRAAAQAADENVAVARTAYLPRLDMVWQTNRATHNNVFGLWIPSAAVPPVSGPVLGTRSLDSVWGSAAGFVLSWDAVDFGQRRAVTDAAKARAATAQAREEATRLDIAGAAADAFLTVLVADEQVRAARANVDRLAVFVDAVRTLVSNQLRPGADQSRTEAELAIARNQLTQATQLADIARASLAHALGQSADTGPALVALPTETPPLPGEPARDLKSHPAARADAASIDAVRAVDESLARSYRPRVTLHSLVTARGSGADIPGLPSRGSGAWLQVPNWAAFASVTFSAFELFSINARRRVEAQNEVAETARYEQTLLTLTTQAVKAQALAKATLEIARNTPIERQAALDAESRARARYQNGLAPITEVADAQRLLAQAEADDAIARLSVWRARLALAQASGDLKPFLDAVSRP